MAGGTLCNAMQHLKRGATRIGTVTGEMTALPGSASRDIHIPDSVPVGPTRTLLEHLQTLRRNAGTPSLKDLQEKLKHRGYEVSIPTLSRQFRGETLSPGLVHAVAYTLAEMDGRPTRLKTEKEWNKFDERLRHLTKLVPGLTVDQPGNVESEAHALEISASEQLIITSALGEHLTPGTSGAPDYLDFSSGSRWYYASRAIIVHGYGDADTAARLTLGHEFQKAFFPSARFADREPEIRYIEPGQPSPHLPRAHLLVAWFSDLNRLLSDANAAHLPEHLKTQGARMAYRISRHLPSFWYGAIFLEGVDHNDAFEISRNAHIFAENEAVEVAFCQAPSSEFSFWESTLDRVGNTPEGYSPLTGALHLLELGLFVGTWQGMGVRPSGNGLPKEKDCQSDM